MSVGYYALRLVVVGIRNRSCFGLGLDRKVLEDDQSHVYAILMAAEAIQLKHTVHVLENTFKAIATQLSNLIESDSEVQETIRWPSDQVHGFE